MQTRQLPRPVAALVLLASPALAQGGATIYVTTGDDSTDFSGAQTVAELPGPDGVVSMREAVLAANNTPGPQTIGFQIPATDFTFTGEVARLRIDSSPWVLSDDGTVIDGNTQTAFLGDTNPDGKEIEFMNAHPAYLGSTFFDVTASSCEFRGLGSMINRGYGIALRGSGNSVVDCEIGGPLYAAVRLLGDDNVVGGAGAGAGNRLSSGNEGVRIEGTATGNLVIGNFLSGSVHGVLIREQATDNTIGGLLPGEGNRIAEAGHSGEHGFPIGSQIEIESDGNRILGNFVGTDATGTEAAFNVGSIGIEIASAGNLVVGNVVGGISGPGIGLRDGAEDNVLRGNSVGVDATGTIPIPNGFGVGFYTFATTLPSPAGNVLGGTGPGEANHIAHNASGGIYVNFDARRNRLSGNALHDNGPYGIDLGSDGPTANDLGDLDAGPNDLMNYPVVDTAAASASGTWIHGKLDAIDPATCTVELFHNPTPPFGGVVEAEVFLGVVTPDALGRFALAVDLDLSGRAITATATDAEGNTSELSGPRLVQPSGWSQLGAGVAGTLGVPAIAGFGPCTPSSAWTVELAAAPPASAGAWILGTTEVGIPLAGGTLIPTPELVVPFATDADGRAALGPATWPAGAGAGVQLLVQAWTVDFGAPEFLAATPAAVGTTP